MGKVMEFIHFTETYNWSVAHLLVNHFNYNKDYELVRIGDFLTRNKNQIIVDDDTEYKRVTIKLYNQGVFLRDRENGKNIGTKKQFLIREGQFLLSKIDARNGAFGVVPQNVDNAIITGNFWTFDVDYLKINPHFLALVTTTEQFMHFAQSASSGTTGRHYLQEDFFLNVKIPLPSLNIQKKLVANYQRKLNLAKQQQEDIKNKEKEIELYLFSKLKFYVAKKNLEKDIFKYISYTNLDRWDVQSNSFDVSSLRSQYEFIKVKKLISSTQYGLSEKANLNSNNFPFLRMNNIQNGELEISDLKYIELNDNRQKNYLLNKGDILFNRTNSKELVGKCAVFNLEGKYTFASYLIRLKLNKELIDNDYFSILLNSTIGRMQIDAISRQITGQVNINVEELKSFVLPLPSLEIQRKIVSHILDLKQEIQNLKENSQDNKKLALTEFEKEIFSED